METVCKQCNGKGAVYFGDDEEYDVQPCDCQAD